MKFTRLICLFAGIAFAMGQIRNLPLYEYDALYDLYNSTAGEYWTWHEGSPVSTQWNFGPDANPCADQWQGITCVNSTTDDSLEYVQTLTLEQYNLTGVLPPALGNFSALFTLDLSSNNLYGQIPNEVGKLQEMLSLVLTDNSLTGTIPLSLYSILDINYIKLNNNYLGGSISPYIGNLTNLVVLRLDYNQITGTIPFEVSNCSILSALVLSFNQLHGHIPPELGKINFEMVVLALDNNLLSGSIPVELAGMCNTQMSAFSLSHNQLTGTITDAFNDNCTYLQYLLLDNNTFHGSLPSLTISAMQTLNLGDNQLTGTIPLSATYTKGTRTLTLKNNKLNGTIPEVIFTSARLGSVDLSNNQFSGPLNVAQYSSIKIFDVSNNSLTGPFPEELFTYYVTNIDLSYNKFHATIPDSILEAFQLQTINLNSNEFYGTIPSAMLNLSLLQALSFANNQLTGTIPAFQSVKLPGFPNQMIEGFDVHANFLEGTLPPSLFAEAFLLVFNVGENLLTGEIPDLSALDSVSGLSMYDNLLTGSVPSEVSKLPSLQLLFFDNNMLTGDLGSMFNPSVQTVLKYVDVSNNQIRGTIPTSPFEVQSLMSFAAVSNCLYGSLPTETICSLQNLTTLAMDGMESSTACQYLFFPRVPSVYNAYGLYHTVPGGIDRCLFNMPRLETLHLSGNAITGSIPDDVVVSGVLTDLALSHNLLSGTIPDNVQFHRWNNLDLSYNKLTGGLSHSFPELAENASLSLEVNRLSGVIPHSLKYAVDINILDGNLWKCDTERTQLPVNDKHTDIYECGSNTFNYSLYIWLALCVIAVGIKACVWQFSLSRKDENHWSKVVFKDLNSWMAIFEVKEGKDYDDSNFLKFVDFTDSIRKVCAVVVAFEVLILIPIYIALSFTENTYSYEYAWTLSAAYLSGLTSTVVLMIGLAALCLLCVIVLFKFVNYNHQLIYPSVFHGCPSALISSFIAVVLVNVAVVTAVNIGYVYVHVTYDSSIVHACQFALAVFKLLWNNWAVRELLKLTKQFEVSHESWLVTSKSKYGRQRIGLEVLMILFNNLGAPFIATALVSSDCFYNIIASPPRVNVSYSYKACIDSEFFINGSQCLYYDQAEVVSTSYEPPFLYSYQCGSTFITTYATIYVFMFCITAFIAPIALALANLCYRSASEGSQLKELIGSLMPKILKLKVSLNKTVKKIDSSGSNGHNDSNDSDFKVFEYNVIFHCDLFVVKVINIFAMIMTFGAVLPPLAVVGLVALVSFTYYSQLLIGRFVVKAGAGEDRRLVVESMNRDCEHAADMFMNAVWIVAPFTMVFYAILLLDTLGDAEGWHKALWAPIVTVSLPISCWLAWKARKQWRRNGEEQDKKDSFFDDQTLHNSLTENPMGPTVGIVGKL